MSYEDDSPNETGFANWVMNANLDLLRKLGLTRNQVNVAKRNAVRMRAGKKHPLVFWEQLLAAFKKTPTIGSSDTHLNTNLSADIFPPDNEPSSPVAKIVEQQKLTPSWTKNATVMTVCALGAKAMQIGRDMLGITRCNVCDEGRKLGDTFSQGLGRAILKGYLEEVPGDDPGIHHDEAVA